MFVLDTNVLSEIMKSSPDPAVARWIARQPRALVFTTVVSKAEILAGIAMMPSGRRQRALQTIARDLFGIGFRDHLLPFDDVATAPFAEISTARRRAGRMISVADSIIAAIARAHDASVVTRDLYGFELTGVTIINPWEPNPT